MGFHNLVNTHYFREAALDFEKNKKASRDGIGCYTRAPQGSREYEQYWKDQEDRCKYGYKVGDLWIPGRYYFYLNFFPIYRVPEEVREEARLKNREIQMSEKVQSFPAFWEIDYEWWNFKHIAWYGGKWMGVDAGAGGRHLSCLKTRGAGFSYKEAADGVYNYNFIDGSKSYFFAATEPFLVGDAIMDKVKEGLDWINTYCPYWMKNRQVKNTLMHQKASYLDEFGKERGSKSEIIAQIVDKPSKTRGKRGRKASFEEGGSFPNLETAVEVSLGSLREGTNVYVGQLTVFGTGGEEGPGIQGLENIHSNPEAWDMLIFKNIWEDGMYGTDCGYFVPSYRANIFHMDQDGNVDMINAIKADDLERAKKKKTGKPKDLDRRKAEYPRNPAEALQRLTGNGFNIAQIDAQINRIRNNKAIQGMIRHGQLARTEDSYAIGGVEFLPQTKDKARPIEDYPHKEGDDLTGCISILQAPWQDGQGKVPDGMYHITFDAYYKDQSDDLTSLFSIKVWKNDNPHDPSYSDLPVAWYAGRPLNSVRNHEILFMLTDFYNCKAQGEISGGGQAVVTYAKTHRKLHRLENEPEMAHNKEVASKSAGNSYLMNMPPERKKLGILYLEDWHMEPRGVRADGSMIYNIDEIYDIAFLRELRKFNPEKGNYDRVSDAIIAMFMQKEKKAIQYKRRKETRDFYANQRVLFGAGDGAGRQETTSFY